MAIDLFCYSSLPFNQVTKSLDTLITQHPTLFGYKKSDFEARFVIYEATETDDIEKEMALEYKLAAKSFF